MIKRLFEIREASSQRLLARNFKTLSEAEDFAKRLNVQTVVEPYDKWTL